MSPRDAYDAAQPRFVTDTIEIEGVPYARMTDAVLNLRVTVEDRHRTMLGWLFRSRWMERHHGVLNGCG
jgi:hypothetical protein